MRKRILAVLLTAILSVVCLGSMFGVSAQTPSEAVPYSTYCLKCISDLSISGSTATCKSTVKGTSSVTKIYVNQNLQKKTSTGGWSNVTHWNTTVSGNSGTVTKTQTGLASGTYRLLTVATFYAGSATEQASSVSAERP